MTFKAIVVKKTYSFIKNNAIYYIYNILTIIPEVNL